MPATKEQISKKLWMLACTPLTVPAGVQQEQQQQHYVYTHERQYYVADF
jgi:hypothetical protein